MLTLDTLFSEDAGKAAKPEVSGKWFEIRVAPDLVSGERLNIGVGFIRSRTKEFSFRLLNSAAPFGCLYGPAGKEQFGFLLAVLRESLLVHGPSPTISPQISFGSPRFASGDSVDSILDSLFNSVVTLARRSYVTEELMSPTERRAPRSTESIRKKIRRSFKKNDPKGFTHVWRDMPVIIPEQDRHHAIDMQIWQEQGLFNPRCFATIVSTCYKDPHCRKAFLMGAYHGLTIARSFMANESRGGIFILMPAQSEFGETETTRQIENEIDNTTWALMKKFNIHPVVEETLDRLKEKALEFAI